jgi:glycosyltransferase involved in cell wall biosynthesis
VKRLLTIGHSYVVAQNRRLAHEMARQGQGEWEVTAAAPSALPGDLGRIDLEPIDGEWCHLRRLGVRFAALPHVRRYDSALRALMREPWDVVHVWEEPYVCAGAQIVRLAPRSSCVIPATFQNIDKQYPPPFDYLERRSMRRAGGWIAFGRTVHETLSRRPGYAAKPSRIISPGVDTSLFHPDPSRGARVRADLGWTDGPPIVGFVGRFVEAKGLRVLIAALERTRTPWRALLVGSGELLHDIRAFARKYPGRVAVFTGVTHADVPAYLNAMDLLCVPSQTTVRWREQFGRVLIEAMASGVPIIASHSGEIPFVVGDAGRIVDEADVDAWARAIEGAVSDHEWRTDSAARGMSRVADRFDLALVARAHLAFFEELVTGRCAA